MNSYFENKRLPEYAPAILRLGIAGVMIWFGTSQLINQSMWASFIPDWAITITFLSATKLVILNGLFEVVAGVLLALGIFIRPLSILLFVHMLGIISTIGLSPIGIRDIGIATALLSIAFYGNDIFSVKDKNKIENSL